MLTDEERGQVQAAVENALLAQQNPRELLGIMFAADKDLVLGQIDPRPNAAAYAPAVMTLCLASRWSQEPSLMESLLVFLVVQRGIGAFQPLVERVHRKEDPNPSPYDSFWLTTQRPFFDRARLRECVQRLVETSATPILRIRAPLDSYGRTYSRDFIDHVALGSQGVVKVVHAYLSPGTGPTYDAKDLADELIESNFGKPTPPLSSASRPRELSRFILGSLMERPGLWIVVLDGFGQLDRDDEARQTIELLASKVPGGEFRTRIRLILVDYPHDLPDVGVADVLEEDLMPVTQITPELLMPAVAAIGALRATVGRPPLEPGQLPAVLTWIFTDAPAGGKDRLKAFNLALTRVWDMPNPTP